MRHWWSSLFTLLVLATGVLPPAWAGTRGAASAPPPGAEARRTQRVPVEGGGSYINADAAGLATLLEKKDFLLINVHVPYQGEIKGTDLFLPFNLVEANQGKLPADKNRKLVLYCQSGRMSAIAARTLVKLGYTQVWNLDGGMIAWRQAGYPVDRRQ